MISLPPVSSIGGRSSGTCGGGGKAFWEKAGFRVIGTFHAEPWGGYWTDIIERQRKAKDMTEEEVWTRYRMAYEL